jgi:hypothetical protein
MSKMSSGVIVMYCHGLMYRWDDVKVGHCYLVMADRKYQMDEIQSGPLMVKSLTGSTQCGLCPPEKLPGPSFIIIQQMKGYNLQQNPL